MVFTQEDENRDGTIECTDLMQAVRVMNGLVPVEERARCQYPEQKLTSCHSGKWHRNCCVIRRGSYNFFRRTFMSEEDNTGNNLIWAITTIIIVAIIAGALYYSGFLGGTKKEKIDINVKTPAASNSNS